MSSFRRLMMITAILAFGAGTADAVIVPTAQSRTVAATAHAQDSQTSGDDSDSDLAPDFGPFDRAVSATVLLAGALGAGTGSQDSEILPIAIRAAGSHSANGEGWEPGGAGNATGSSHFEVTFDLTEDADYAMTGTLEAFDSGSTTLQLTGPSGTIHFLSPSNESIVVAEVGNLLAGSYTLVIESSGSAFGDFFFYDYASGFYDIDFAFPAATGSRIGEVGAAGIMVAPNPFRTTTRIRPGSGNVTVHDLRGRVVRRLTVAADGATEWDARDDRGRPLPSGVYFVNVAGDRESTRTKVTLIR